MIVVYYTQTYFLDAVIETIQSIKNEVELHLLIELSPESKKSTIIDIDDLNGLPALASCEKVLGSAKWKLLEKYFKGVASVQFVVHNHKKAFSPASLRIAARTGQYIQQLKADIIHFDTVSGRSIGMYPYIRSKKIFITVHDPMPHTGEGSWKKKIPEFVLYHLAKRFFFYSHFAANQFNRFHGRYKSPISVLRFQPFSYIQQFELNENTDTNIILFFGRLSEYKGIDLLLKAIPNVLKIYPDEVFVIAGASSYGFQIDRKMTGQFSNNIQLIERNLSVPELVSLLSKAKFIVCPYRDATQSGVLMTAFAAGKMAVATNIGAFPEYIDNNITGMLTTPDPTAIADVIIKALKNNHYKKIEKSINKSYDEAIGNKNMTELISAYQSQTRQ